MEKQETSADIFVHLVNLRNVAGSRIHLRLVLAVKLLSDKEWVQSENGGGGSEVIALERLEEEAFGEVCGAMPLSDMLELVRRIPDESVWKQNRYNLKRMHKELLAQNRAAKATAVEDLVTETGGKFQPTTDQRDLQIQSLKAEVRALRKDNAILKKDNEHLRRVIKRIHGDLAAQV